MKKNKMTWEEYQKRIGQVRRAVLKDLNEVNPEITLLKVRLWCRDEEDRFDILCYEDFSPYMDGVYKRYNPDVKKWMQNEYEGLKRWFDTKNYTDDLMKKYRGEIYSPEQICKKFYVSIMKYVEIEGELTILYEAHLSLNGEVISVNDPTGYYTGFDYSKKGYILSDAEQVISDNLSLFWDCENSEDFQEPLYKVGDLLYVDGSPYERPFYGVCCDEGFLFIPFVENLKIIEKYHLSKALFPFSRLFLEYHKEIPPFYHVQRLDSCDYQCLTKAGEILKNSSETTDIKTAVQKVFEEEFKDAMFPTQSGSRMKEILEEFVSVQKIYPNLSFTGILDRFYEWLWDIKYISNHDLDDEAFFKLFSEYCKGDPNQQEAKRKKYEKFREDRDLDWSKRVDFE